jgi:CDGSH iron-sulfur domain-containing protein 3
MEETKKDKTEATIELLDFGPIKISGNFVLKDLKRDIEETPGEVLLCRCGKSGNKPYCDDSHKK